MALSSNLTAYFKKRPQQPENLNQVYVGNIPTGLIGKYIFQFVIYEAIC